MLKVNTAKGRFRENGTLGAALALLGDCRLANQTGAEELINQVDCLLL